MLDIPYPENGDKKAIRAFYRRRLASVVPQGAVCKAAEMQIRHALFELLSGSPGASVAVFSAYGHEPELTPAFEEWHDRGYRVCLPCSLADDDIPVFRLHLPGDSLQHSGSPAFKQPLPDKMIISPDVIVCPLLAFDQDCNRLGQGGGYYDRAIAQYKPALTVGAGFAALEAIRTLPAEPHDVQPDYVVTEKRVFCRN